MPDPNPEDVERLDHWLEGELEQALPGPTPAPVSPQPSPVLAATRRRLLEGEGEPEHAPGSTTAVPRLRLLIPATFFAAAAALLLMVWWTGSDASLGGIGAIELVALEDLRTIVDREVLGQHESFFRPELRGAGDPERRPTILPVPSRAHPTLPQALNDARSGDVILLARRERPDDLPLRGRWSEDAAARTARIEIDGKTLEVRFFTEAVPAWEQLQDAYRSTSRDLTSAESPAGNGPRSLLLQLPQAGWVVRVFAVAEGVAEPVFPVAPAGAWFPAREGRQLLPPAEPVIAYREDGGKEQLLYPSQLADPRAPAGLPRLWIADGQTVFIATEVGTIARADAEVLPSPQGLSGPPEYDHLLVVAASRPLSSPVPVADLAARLQDEVSSSPDTVVREWRDDWQRRVELPALKIYLWTPSAE